MKKKDIRVYIINRQIGVPFLRFQPPANHNHALIHKISIIAAAACARRLGSAPTPACPRASAKLLLLAIFATSIETRESIERVLMPAAISSCPYADAWSDYDYAGCPLLVRKCPLRRLRTTRRANARGLGLGEQKPEEGRRPLKLLPYCCPYRPLRSLFSSDSHHHHTMQTRRQQGACGRPSVSSRSVSAAISRGSRAWQSRKPPTDKRAKDRGHPPVRKQSHQNTRQ